MKEAKTPIVAQNAWWCDTCNNQVEMTKDAMMEHLRSVHSLDTKGLKVSRQMQQHIDGDTWFSSVWDIKIITPSGAEIKLTNSTCNPRAKDDPMRFA